MLETVSEDPRAQSPGAYLQQLAGTLRQQNDDAQSLSPKTSKPLRKAEVLGIETRNVAKHWLQPVALSSRAPDGRTGQLSTQPSQEQLHPTYGPGQNSPQELNAIRAKRMLHSLGRTAIFSHNPYVENVFETLVQHNAAPGTALQAVAPRRGSGKVPKPGSKAAAIRRAKRILSQDTPFRPEVPFEDAMRVACLHHDKNAMPAMLDAYIISKPKLTGTQLERCAQVLAAQSSAVQLQAIAILVQHGFYFASIKTVYNDPELLRATLDEIKLIITQNMDEQQWQAAFEGWLWKEADKELFMQQFQELRIISYYKEVRRQLRALRTQGIAPLVRVEREMLAKVVQDFKTQIDEEALQTARSQPDLHAEISAVSSRRADALARAEADRKQQAAARERIREEREAREAAAAAARAAAKADLEAKRAERDAQRQAVKGDKERDKEKEAELMLEREKERERKLQEKEAEKEAKRREKEEEKERLTKAKEQKELEKRQAKEQALQAAAAAQKGKPAEAGRPHSHKEAPVSQVPVSAGRRAVQGDAQHPALPVAQPSQASVSDKASTRSGKASGRSQIAQEASQGSVKPSATESPAEATQAEAEEPVAPPTDTSPDAAPPPPAEDAGAADATEAVPAEDASAIPQAASRRSSSSSARLAIQVPVDQPAPAEQLALASPTGSTASGKPASAAASPKAASRQPSQAGSQASKASTAKPPAVEAVLRGAPTPITGTPPSADAYGSLPPTPNSGKRSEASRVASQAPPADDASDTKAAEVDQDTRAEIEGGLAKLKQAGEEARRTASEAAEAARRRSSSLTPSRQSTPASSHKSQVDAMALAPTAAATEQIAITAMFTEEASEEQFDAERARVAEALAAEKQRQLEAAVEVKAATVAALVAAREQLHSAQSSQRTGTPDRPLTPQEKKVAVAIDENLRKTEMQLQVERQALALLEEQKRKHEEEKKVMNEQLAKTMRLFQEQLSSTIKMAAMLQAQRIMTGAPSMETPQLPQMPLPQEVDEPPTEEEIIEYGRYLGMDVTTDADLLYIAEWALTAPVPEGWTVHLDQEGHEFFFNAATNKSSYEHPMDQHYKEYYKKKKLEKKQSQGGGGGGDKPREGRAKAIRV